MRLGRITDALKIFNDINDRTTNVQDKICLEIMNEIKLDHVVNQ